MEPHLILFRCQVTTVDMFLEYFNIYEKII